MQNTGTPIDLDGDDMELAALDRDPTDGPFIPDPTPPAGYEVGAEDDDTFEPIDDDELFVDPDSPDANYEEDEDLTDQPELPYEDDGEEVNI